MLAPNSLLQIDDQMVEILCTVTGIVAGIAVVAAIMSQQGDRAQFQAKDSSSAEDAEKLKGLTNQLQMLTFRVAADVSAHTEKVVHINESLQPAAKEPERIVSAISELIQANESMQGQLAAAQLRLSQQTQQIEAAARQARTDALTGLANRRALDEFLKTCIEANSPNAHTGLLLLDVDHFKRFNDSYGHTTGDAVLASFARSIAKWSNGKCYAARYGGEEFAVILSRPSIEELAAAAGDLRKYVSEQIIAHEDLQLTLTSSGGLTFLQAGDTIQQAYERADEGLYRSKKAGRNCGHWLHNGEWVRLPSSTDELSIAVASSMQPDFGQAIMPAPEPSPDVNQTANQAAPAASPAAMMAPPAESSASASAADTAAPAARNNPQKSSQIDILDLNTFLERLEQQLNQLGRAELPATAIVVEAVGLAALSPSDAETCWNNAVTLVQSQIRGIDVICRLRQYTLCVFMPGCSLNAAAERAGRMQLELESLRSQSTNTKQYPTRFAVAAATAQHNEACGTFLQRLEYAIEEAQDAKPTELVVHDGATCYLQPAA